eukprot:11174417-Lingulodinium_polyedra.AAC.1
MGATPESVRPPHLRLRHTRAARGLAPVDARRVLLLLHKGLVEALRLDLQLAIPMRVVDLLALGAREALVP